MASSHQPTFYTSPVKGTGVKGVELDRCYAGEYKDGKRHGYGVYNFPNGMKYEGQYFNGLKHGHGKLAFKDGGYYEGQFHNDEIQGQGTRRFANGNIYVGHFERGDMHGYGVYRFANGNSYEGYLALNCFEGEGVAFRLAKGDAYQGEFRQHRMTGRGSMTYANGDRYEGDWVDGKRCGQGLCSFSNGDVYVGEWDHDVFQGEGEITLARQQLVYRGLFMDGLPSKVPTKVNCFWFPPDDPKKGAAAKKPPGGKDGDVPLLPMTPGQPLASAIITAVQLQEPLPPPTPEQLAAEAAAPKGKQTPKGAGGDPKGPVMAEAPAPGHRWTTADNEYNRVVNLTLHAGAPRPLPEGVEVGVLLANTLLPDGTVRVRLLLLPVSIEPPLLMQRAEGEAVHGLQAVMEAGAAKFEQLVIGGAPEDTEKIMVPGGVGCLLACAWGLAPGYTRIQLPELKAAKGGKGK